MGLPFDGLRPLFVLLLLAVLGLAACDWDTEPPPPPPGALNILPAGPHLLLVGGGITLTAQSSIIGPTQWVSRSPAVASVVGSGPNHFTGTVAALSVGTTWIVASALGINGLGEDSVEVRVTAGLVEVLPTGLRPLIVRNAEGISLLTRRPGGGLRGGSGAFANLTGNFLAAVAGADGYVVVDLLTNEPVLQATNLSGPFFGVVGASQDPPGPASAAALFAFGGGGWALNRYGNGAFQPVFNSTPGPIYDAFPAGGRVGSDVIPFVQPGQAVRFIEYDPPENRYTLTGENLLAGLFQGELVSAYLHGDRFGAERDPILVLTRAVNSSLYLVRRDGSPPQLAFNVGLDARKVRCAESGAGGLVCGITVFGADRVALARWDGAGAPSLAGFADVGDGPVDLDLRALGNGNVALVTTGFNDRTVTEIEVRPDGSVASNATRAVPAGCQNPGHAIYVEDAEGLKVVGTCYASGNYFIEASRF